MRKNLRDLCEFHSAIATKKLNSEGETGYKTITELREFSLEKPTHFDNSAQKLIRENKRTKHTQRIHEFLGF